MKQGTTVVETVVETADRPTFESMLATELPGLRARCRALTSNHSDADDLVQDVLLRAYRAYDRFDGRYPKAWLYTIARNTNISNAQARRHTEPVDPAIMVEREQGEDGREASVEGLLREDTARDLRRAIDHLEPAFREIAELALVEGRSVGSVADRLDIPYGTVLSRLYRTRQRLRMILNHQQLVADARF